MSLNDRSAAGTPIRRIYLTGFMGAGKSTVGALLARKLKWRFFDTDQVIESKAGIAVADIFAQHGEQYFRRLESEALYNLQSEHDAVISLGGGAVETAEVRELLMNDGSGNFIFLEAPLARLVERCTLQELNGVTRPLLHDEALLHLRYERRLVHYQTAHLTVATQELNPEEVAASILKHMAALAENK